MWWGLVVQAGAFDDIPLEGARATPKGELVFAPSLDNAPPNILERFERTRALEMQLLEDKEWGLSTTTLRAEIDHSYDQLFIAYREACARADIATSALLHAQLGFLLERQDRLDDAAKEWQGGLVLAPTHPLAAASHVALGDYFFQRNALLPAIAHYRKASTHPEFGRYAWYKLAWCDYNLGKTERSVEALLNAIQGEHDALAREARQDLPRFLVPFSPDEARKALAVACVGQQDCLDDLSMSLVRARADAGVLP